MTLSDRFDQMETARAVVKPVFNTGSSQRRGDIDSRRKVGRQIQFDARRQGVANPKPAMRAAQSKVVSPRQQPQQQQRMQQGRGRGRGFQAGGGRNQKPGGMPPRMNVQKTTGRGGAANGRGGGRGAGRGAGRTGGRGNNNTGARGAGRGGRGGRGAGRGGRGNTKESTKPPKDLDEGLDEYWFKAGKGPDPKVASLDRGMDSYWSKTDDKTNGDAAAGDKMEDAEVPEAVVVAPVAGVDPDL